MTSQLVGAVLATKVPRAAGVVLPIKPLFWSPISLFSLAPKSISDLCGYMMTENCLSKLSKNGLK